VEQNEQIYKRLDKLSDALESHIEKSGADATDMKLSLQEIKQYQKSDRELLKAHQDKLTEWDSIRDFSKGIIFVVGLLWLGLTGFVSWLFSRHP